MKKFLFLFAAVITLLSACKSDEPLPAFNKDEVASLTRSKTEAIELAISHMQNRSGSRNVYSVHDIQIVKDYDSRSSSDTLIYAINFTDERGFALISAARSGEAILGYADEGKIDVKNIEPNSGFQFYMDAATNYVKLNMSKDSTFLIEPIDTTFNRIPNPYIPVTTYESIKPRVTLKWGQNYPEGIYCPNKTSGCTQTAMALMMTAIKQPQTIEYTYPEKDKDSETLDWALISKHDKSTYSGFAESHLSNCPASEETHKTIGRICRELGKRNNASYNAASTSASIYAARNTFIDLLPPGYAVSPVTQFIKTSNAEIFNKLKTNGIVAYFRGDDTTNPDNERGHAWVMCGGERITTTEKSSVIGGGPDIVTVKIYFYFNWGHRGSYNGYFPAGVFDQQKSTTPSRSNFDTNVSFFWVYKN